MRLYCIISDSRKSLLHDIMLHCVLFGCIVTHSTVLYRSILCYLRRANFCYTVYGMNFWYSICCYITTLHLVLYYATSCCIALRYSTSCYDLLCFVVMCSVRCCSAPLFDATLGYAMLHILCHITRHRLHRLIVFRRSCAGDAACR